MATDTRNPTSDESVTGAWTGSAGSRYTLVDDYADTVPNDVLDSPTATGGAQITFGYSAFSIPAGSTSISAQVQYYDRDVTSGTNNSGGRLKVGGNYYNAATHNPNTTLTSRSDNWANNPKTTVAWTVDDINGVGANAIQAFGFNSTDASPALRYSCVRIQVTYNPPISGSLAQTLSIVTISASGTVKISGTSAKTLDSVSISAVGTSPVVGTLGKTLDVLTLTAIGTVTTAGINGSLNVTLSALTLSAQGQIPISGSLSKQLNGIAPTTQGQVLIVGGLSQSLDNIGITAQGKSVAQGNLSSELGAALLSASGGVRVSGISLPTLEDVLLSAIGTVKINGTGSLILSSIGIETGGDVLISGSLSSQLADVTLSSQFLSGGILNAVLDHFELVSSGVVKKVHKLDLYFQSTESLDVYMSMSGSLNFDLYFIDWGTQEVYF